MSLSIGVYKGQEKYIPKDWIMISESDNKSGFHGKAFFKNGTIVIAMRFTFRYKITNYIFLKVLSLKIFVLCLS